MREQLHAAARRSWRPEQREALRDALRRVVAGEVRFSDGDRALYATDASNYRLVPVGVVIPRHVDDVVASVRIAREHEVPVLLRGGGTSLAGQCCTYGLVIDTSKYVHGVLDTDVPNRTVRVLPGTYLDDLRDAVQEFGLTFGPDPATHNHCTIGGMIGNDSCGVHSMLSEFEGPGARTSDNVVALDVLTYDGTRLQVGRTQPAQLDALIARGGRVGEIYAALRGFVDRHAGLLRTRFPQIHRRVSGYNLPALLPENGFHVAQALTGSESTCVTILEATLALVPAPRARALLVLGYDSVYDAGDAVPRLREHRPIGLEGMDDVLAEYMRKKHPRNPDLRLLPEGGGWLLAEFGGGDREEAEARARAALRALQRDGYHTQSRLFADADEQHRIWKLRESGLGATAFVPGEPDTWPGWEDSAVPVDRVGDYLRELRVLLERHGYHCSLYGHFGQGCIHTRIDFDLRNRDGIERYHAFTQEAAELVTRYGGSLSGEHGDGQARSDLLPVMYGDDVVDAFREFKSIWDPDGMMNPGRIVDPAGRTDDLRIGPAFEPAEPATRFPYRSDGGSFAHASLRCVGVGECRRTHGGVMCPSYMVLREEKHSTRGRARLLHEMLRGEVINDGWASADVKDALDLCLACKGCRGECPVNVDIPTYKAEFLARHYRDRRRPRTAFAFGWIDVWARAASVAPRLVNFAGRAPVLGAIAKRLAGMAPQRDLPRFARRTFRRRFDARETRNGHAGERVLLWTDTFNNHFQPDVLVAAVRVLERFGYEVALPPAGLCCGRPLYDWGMLDRAESYLRRIVTALARDVDAGVRMVGLEPSCVAVFRDELPNLLADEPVARQLAESTRTLGELLADRLDDVPRLPGHMLLHGHCHHRSVLDFGSDRALLEAVSSDVQLLDSGCCGMAGAFGFEAHKYDVSVAIGERVLLPAVRRAAPDTTIVTDGFSCREQIAQLADRTAIHTVQVLDRAFGGRAADDW